jgi:hypothetical protein
LYDLYLFASTIAFWSYLKHLILALCRYNFDIALKLKWSRHRWLMPAILSIQEAEIRRIAVRSHLRQIIRETLSWKTLSQKIGLVEWLKVKALSSSPRTKKKKNFEWFSVPLVKLENYFSFNYLLMWTRYYSYIEECVFRIMVCFWILLFESYLWLFIPCNLLGNN